MGNRNQYTNQFTHFRSASFKTLLRASIRSSSFVSFSTNMSLGSYPPLPPPSEGVLNQTASITMKTAHVSAVVIVWELTIIPPTVVSLLGCSAFVTSLIEKYIKFNYKMITSIEPAIQSPCILEPDRPYCIKIPANNKRALALRQAVRDIISSTPVSSSSTSSTLSFFKK